MEIIEKGNISELFVLKKYLNFFRMPSVFATLQSKTIGRPIDRRVYGRVMERSIGRFFVFAVVHVVAVHPKGCWLLTLL